MRLYGVDILKCIWEHDEQLPPQRQLLKERDEARSEAEKLRDEVESLSATKRVLPWEVGK